jgi:MFS family permease
MTTESLLVLTPITMPQQFQISHLAVALFLSITAGIVFPITYFINNLIKEQTERKIIFVLLILCFVSCLFIINLPVDVSLVRFIISYTVLFVSCNILESVDSALLAQIFPSNLNLGFCNSGFTIILTTTGGKFIGSFLITIIGWFLIEEVVYDCIISFYLLAYLVLCILVYNNYSDLRVKAIARIIQKKEHKINK